MFAPVLWEERLPAFERMRNDFETLFHRFFPGELVENKPLWETDLKEEEKELVARLEMPGFEPENILIEVVGERLHVKAERKYERERKEGKEWRTTYERYVTLPAAVVLEKAVATYRNGVLEVHLPKTEPPAARRIPVT
jgi:HSP20 family protein